MAYQENPRLINSTNGDVVEINSSPFTLGRGLGNNYVIPIASISRMHCMLQKVDNNWILRDTSTNGTCLNRTLIKSDESPPLKENDVIALDTEKYTFHHCTPSRDISDEQLCRIADSILSKVEVVPTNTSVPVSVVVPSTEDGLLPHKRMKVNPTADHTNTSVVDLTRDSFGKPKTETVNTVDAEIAGPSKISEDCDSKIKKPESEKSKAALEADSREELEDEMQCSICSEMFVKAVTLHCAHTFCKYCIDTWSKTKNICPICRTKITSQTPTLVLDNVIEMVVQNSSEEVKQHRKQLLEEREKCSEKPVKAKGKEATGGRIRGSTNNQSVIEVSSASDSDASTISDSEWQDDYDEDSWYERGYSSRAYYGGYGHCFVCGRRGHWANGCPYR